VWGAVVVVVASAVVEVVVEVWIVDVLEGAVTVVLVAEGSVVVVVVVATTQEPRSSGTSARMGTGGLSTPSKSRVTASSRTEFRTIPLAPLCAALPAVKVILRPGCADRSRSTPSS